MRSAKCEVWNLECVECVECVKCGVWSGEDCGVWRLESGECEV